MTIIKLPSVQIDTVRGDPLDATAAEIVSSLGAPYALVDGYTLLVSVNGGIAQTVTFVTDDFDLIGAATAEEVAAVIAASLTGATSEADGDDVAVWTAAYGTGATLQVTGGSAAALFGFPGGVTTGTAQTGALVVMNRNPEPDEIEVPTDAVIYLDIYDPDGTAVLDADITVYVDGVVALSGGVFNPAYTGPEADISNPDPAIARVSLHPTTTFLPDELIEVRVVVGSLDESWTFRVIDLLDPNVISVLSVAVDKIRVRFDEAVLQVDAANGNDALNPANYTATPEPYATTGRPAVRVVATSVESIAEDEVEVTFDIPLTFDYPYVLTVANVEDTDDNGNIISSPGDTADFLSFMPPWPATRRFEYRDFIVAVAKKLDETEDLDKFAGIIQEVIDLLLYDIDRWTNIIDPDVCSEAFLDAILVDLGNPFEFGDLTVTEKRRLVRILVQIYKAKGTGQGVIDVIRFFLGIEVEIDVFNGSGWELTTDDVDPSIGDELSQQGEDAPDPAVLGPGDQALLYTFVVVSPQNLTDDERDRMMEIVEYMKPAHTHHRISEPSSTEEIDHVELGLSELGSPGIGAGHFILHS